MRLRPPFHYDDVMRLVVLGLLAVLIAGMSLGCAGAFHPRDGLPAMNEIAANYPNEIAACVYEDGWEVPLTDAATTTLVSPAPCADSALALWHAHPEDLTRGNGRFWMFARKHGLDPNNPRDLCYLSQPDVKYALHQADSIPDLEYTMVGVNQEIWCWWTIDQVRERRQESEGNGIVRPIPGQTSWYYDPELEEDT